jgi:hypothetical protein
MNNISSQAIENFPRNNTILRGIFLKSIIILLRLIEKTGNREKAKNLWPAENAAEESAYKR